jgi:hypothetical protein
MTAVRVEMRPRIGMVLGFAAVLAGCALKETEVATVSPSHITVCRIDIAKTAQAAEDIAVRHCAAQGMMQRAVSGGFCSTNSTMIATRYECGR